MLDFTGNKNYPAGKEEEMAWKALNHGLRGSLAYGNHPCSHSQATTSGSKAAISNARRSDQRLNGRPRGDDPRQAAPIQGGAGEKSGLPRRTTVHSL